MSKQPIFGDILRAARKAQGLTQSQLEARSGIGIRNIAYLECGDSNPNLSTMLILATALGVNLRIEFEADPAPVVQASADEKVYDFKSFLADNADLVLGFKPREE